MQHLLSLARPLHPGIALSFWWQIGLLLASAAAYPFDPRSIMGVNPWLKPIKFEISVALFLLTVGLLLNQLEQAYGRPDATRTWGGVASSIGWTIAIAMIVENSLIAIQSARGVRSHMNNATLLDGGIFGVMGFAILVNTGALAILLILYLDPETHWEWPMAVNVGVRLGLAVLILGSLEGVVMVNNKQHLVGAPDSGGGVPFLNWSTTAGDLRIAHFFAIHALQIFMVLGFLLSRTRAPRVLQAACVIGFATLYMGGCYWLFRLAMHGRVPLRSEARVTLAGGQQ